ncbi:MAG: hypothetical protein GY790_19375 [Bacteroidetes bacterium]|nr:hypothetical protein [Bacteroidota bacterium]
MRNYLIGTLVMLMVLLPDRAASKAYYVSVDGDDATGAMAIMNIGSWKTWSRDVLTHTLSANCFIFKHLISLQSVLLYLRMERLS